MIAHFFGIAPRILQVPLLASCQPKAHPVDSTQMDSLLGTEPLRSALVWVR